MHNDKPNPRKTRQYYKQTRPSGMKHSTHRKEGGFQPTRIQSKNNFSIRQRLQSFNSAIDRTASAIQCEK